MHPLGNGLQTSVAPRPIHQNSLVTRSLGHYIPGMSEEQHAMVRRTDPFLLEEVTPLLPERGITVPQNVRFTPQVITDILNGMAKCGAYGRACISAGVSPVQWKRLRKDFPVLEELASVAKELYRQTIRQAIHDRAVDGWEEPVYWKGELTGTIRRFSDRLLELQAKRHCPEYRDRSQLDVNVAGGVLVVHQPAMSAEEFKAQCRKEQAIPGEKVE